MTVFPAGHILTSEDFDDLFPEGVGAWTSYTPTVSQGATTNIAKTINYSAWTREGRKITWEFYVTITGTGTASNNIVLTVPVAGTGAGPPLGSGFIYDASTTGLIPGVWSLVSATTCSLFVAGTGAGIVAGGAGGTMAAALANGDQIRGQAIYEAAS